MSAAPLLVATVETTPPKRVHLESPQDAEWLATATGCRVRVTVETLYEPKAPVPVPVPPQPNGAPASNAAADSAAEALSAPERVRQRMNAQPDRVWRASDFLDIGDASKLGNVLHRLAEDQRQIERVGRGEYRALRAPAAATRPDSDARTGEQVMAYMQQHPGEWQRAAQVLGGMGLSEERKSAVTAALVRLARRGKLSKRGSTFCYLTRAARQEVRSP